MRLRRFPSSSNPSRLALSNGRGLCTLDAVALAAVGDRYIVMVWISNLGHSRFRALIVVERRLVALLFLVVGAFRLTTPLLRQWLMIHLRPSAGLRWYGGFGYLDAPPAFSIIEQSFAARCIGWAEVFELSTP